MNKSYESMGSNEEEQPHFNYDSDGEPPADQVGDKLTIIKKAQVVKTILEVGEQFTGKPGRPYIVKVNLIGYFAPDDPNKEEGKEGDQGVRTKTPGKHIRISAEDI